MKFSGLKLKLFHKNRAGFTLIEIMVAVAITGIIALGAAISSGQLLNQTSRDTDYTAASRHAMNAIHWISRDVLMAQTITGVEGFPQTDDLSLFWRGWDNSEHSVNYTLEDGTLKRTYSDGITVSTTLIAEFINPAADMTYCTSDNGVLTLTVTSTIGEGARIINVTKTRKITNRSKL